MYYGFVLLFGTFQCACGFCYFFFFFLNEILKYFSIFDFSFLFLFLVSFVLSLCKSNFPGKSVQLAFSPEMNINVSVLSGAYGQGKKGEIIG